MQILLVVELEDNIKRIIPNGLTANINLSKIKINKIFKWIKKQNVSDKEMLKTFNCGVGFCLIIKQKNLKKSLNTFQKNINHMLLVKIVEEKKSQIK